MFLFCILPLCLLSPSHHSFPSPDTALTAFDIALNCPLPPPDSQWDTSFDKPFGIFTRLVDVYSYVSAQTDLFNFTLKHRNYKMRMAANGNPQPLPNEPFIARYLSGLQHLPHALWYAILEGKGWSKFSFVPDNLPMPRPGPVSPYSCFCKSFSAFSLICTQAIRIICTFHYTFASFTIYYNFLSLTIYNEFFFLVYYPS